MFYRYILKPIFFRFDPEDVHDFMTAVGAFLGRFAVTRRLVDLMYGYHGPDISKTVDGIRWKTPFILSAGFDYNAQLMGILPSIGLGGEEVGSITSRPCAGNPKPRLTRLKKSQSILVNKGLRNDGVEKIIERLQIRKLNNPTKEPFVVGVSIARTNDPAASSDEAGIEDYFTSFKRLNEEDVGDYYTINISCPNAYGGETFTTPDLLNRLFMRLDEVECDRPVYLKMPINLPWEQFHSLLKVADIHGVNGVIIGNLNKNYDSLDVRDEAPAEYCGGLSGKPCRDLSTELIRKTKAAYGSRFTIIGCGGVMSSEDAREKFEAGADLIMLITGLIYRGPGLISRLCRAYASRRSDRGRTFRSN